MTPNDIEFLIHCYVSPTPHPRIDAIAVKEVLQSFLTNGLIEAVEDKVYTTTERGKAHIHQLCSLAWPVQKWTDEQDRIIELTQPEQR